MLHVQSEASLGYPVENYRSFPINSPFGHRWGRFHYGIDLGVPIGTPLLAMDNGIVTGTGYQGDGYGNWITYKIPNGLNILYAHLYEPSHLHIGDTVAKGQTIGLSGNSGQTTGPHLHFEIRKGNNSEWDQNQPINPEQLFQ